MRIQKATFMLLCVLLYNLLVGGMNKLTARTGKALEKGNCDTQPCTIGYLIMCWKAYKII